MIKFPKTYSFYAIIFGGLALLLCIFQYQIRFWLAPKQTFFTRMKDHLLGSEIHKELPHDKIYLIYMSIAAFGLILTGIAYIHKENRRMIEVALGLCMFALAFEYVLIAIGIFALLLLFRYLGELMA
jgi:hypothetical protein